jgi:hypothetical protein
MLPFLSDKLFKIGAAVVILGSAPLLFILLMAKIGLWPDPNPNPVGPGLLVFVTFWPGVLLMAAGIFRSAIRRGGKAGTK